GRPGTSRAPSVWRPSSLLLTSSGLDQELDQGADLLGGQLLAESLGHGTARESRYNEGVRGHDRLPDVGRCGLSLGVSGGVLDHPVEVRAHLPCGPGGRERVAAGAAVLGEELLAEPRAGSWPGLLVEPGRERLLGNHVDRAAHQRVPRAAQLGADDLVAAEAVRGGAPVRGYARHRVALQPELRDPERVDQVLRVDLELDGLDDRQVEGVRLDGPASGSGVAVAPLELLAGDVDDHLAALRLLD